MCGANSRSCESLVFRVVGLSVLQRQAPQEVLRVGHPAFPHSVEAVVSQQAADKVLGLPCTTDFKQLFA